MKMHRLLMITILLLSMTTTSTLAGAQGCGDKQGHGDRQAVNFKEMRQSLQLTGAQTEEIKALTRNHRSETAPLREQSRNARRELRELTQAETFDRVRATQLAQTQATLDVELMEARHAMIQKVSAILTPEQQDQWQELRQSSSKP